MDNIISTTQPLRPEYFEEGGAVLIDKPIEWTSFDVVNKLRYAIKGHLNVKKYKVGHAGTLDPLATGLLIICFGKYTKLIDEIIATNKEYKATILLGASTPSYDAETLPDTYYPKISITGDKLEAIVEKFNGPITQLPPMYSAVKVKGVPLYRLARKGMEIERKPRNVLINHLVIDQYDDRSLSLTVNCSKGTYIRSLAHDIGQFLHTGAYLASLRRTQVGLFNVEDALTINQFVDQVNQLNAVTN